MHVYEGSGGIQGMSAVTANWKHEVRGALFPIMENYTGQTKMFIFLTLSKLPFRT